jgi:uncharacterized protein
MSRHIVLAGGSGFIGRHLAAGLVARGDRVTVLTRGQPREQGALRHVRWDGQTAAGWADVLRDADAIVNLAGSSVNTRLTAEDRARVLDSRVDAINAIAAGIASVGHAPRYWINAAGKDIYGDWDDTPLDEVAVPRPGILVELCKAWEAAFDAAAAPNCHKSILRIGIVLGEEGALPVLSRLTQAFLGGAAGDGRQYLSWIHRADMTGMIVWLLDGGGGQGVYNATAPEPVTNADFMATLRRVLGRPWSPPVPSFALRIGAALAGTNGDLVLEGNRVIPARALREGYVFQFPQLAVALRDLTGAASSDRK